MKQNIAFGTEGFVNDPFVQKTRFERLFCVKVFKYKRKVAFYDQCYADVLVTFIVC